MANASCFVLSSAWEGFGNVLIEALACGCPVVSTDCQSGPAEILDGGRFGRLARTGDPVDLARAIVETLDEPIDRERLLARARNFPPVPTYQRYRAIILGQLPRT
jgi:glycosyltransferase involved in cell wall biosynthesis